MLLVVAYFVILAVGWYFGTWKKPMVSLYGPLLLWRTRRGRRSMERAAKRTRFWRAYGVLAIWVCLLSMLLLMLLLLWESYHVLTVPVSPDAAEIELGPLGAGSLVLAVYLVFGLSMAVAAHEYFHGIQTFSERIKLDFIGLVFLVVPIGAFVEPNDEELKTAGEHRRMRIFASGPATNILIAIACLVILLGVLGPSIEPRVEGALVTDVTTNSPAEKFGITIWSEITQIQATPIRNSTDLSHYWFAEPGQEIRVHTIHAGTPSEILMPGGVVVTAVYEGPAFNAGLEPGMIIAALNDTVIHSADDLRSVTENATHNAPVNITVLKFGFDPSRDKDWFTVEPRVGQINLTSKWLFYYKYYPKSANREEYRNLSIMGVSTSVFGIKIEDMDYLPKLVTHPLGAEQDDKGLTVRLLRFVSLPTLGYSPVVSPATELYEPSGLFSGVPSDVYWVIVNVFYWLFWANFLLGIANALPALPFDGGFVLRDGLKRIAHWRAVRITGFQKALGKKALADWQMDQVMLVISAFVYLILVFLLTWQVVGPVF